MRGSINNTPLTEDVYVALVCTLFSTLLPTIIMVASFLIVGGWIVAETLDPALLLLLALTGLAALVRIGFLLVHRDEAQAETLSGVRAGQLERRFAMAYFAFALLFGLFAARAFVIGGNEHRLLIVGLVFGYGAGVAAGISLRPWISIPSALIAIIPTIMVSFLVPGRWSVGMLTAAFLAGGIESMLRRYQATSRQFTMQNMLSTIGRRDELTGLPNQLMLREHFTGLSASALDGGLVAIHVLVIERIDAINRSHGYPAGDILLRAIGERLDRLAGRGLFAARLSGVAFAIVQPDIVQPRRADIVAADIVAVIRRPYIISGQQLSIGAHLGHAIDVQKGADVDRLLNQAREAADRARREAHHVVRHTRPSWGASERAAMRLSDPKWL